MKKHSFQHCLLDGCVYGLKAPAGEPVRKPWHISCLNTTLPKFLSRTCDGSHVHAACAGPELTHTQTYTMQIAGIVHRTLRACGTSVSVASTLACPGTTIHFCLACIMEQPPPPPADAPAAFEREPGVSLQRARIRPPGVTTEEALPSGFRFTQQLTGAPMSKQRPKARSSGFRITRTEQPAPPIITVAGISGMNDASNPWCTHVDILAAE